MMPLVLDDLLVQFDDTSARAALTILSEIARTTVPADLLVEHRIAEEYRSTLLAA
jgi:hypothetical protein